MARKRIDDVYCGDAREIVALIREKFDWIIGGDIVEHLDEPWSFLSELRRVAKPGGHLLLSIPNIAHAALIADLLRGRFDYVYMGLTCVGHLRFFTRRTIEDTPPRPSGPAGATARVNTSLPRAAGCPRCR